MYRNASVYVITYLINHGGRTLRAAFKLSGLTVFLSEQTYAFPSSNSSKRLMPWVPLGVLTVRTPNGNGIWKRGQCVLTNESITDNVRLEAAHNGTNEYSRQSTDGLHYAASVTRRVKDVRSESSGKQ